ncbi:MAG TPA: alpha amylase C-terminal domain-containing protein [Capsulimonadaceae bacterium]|jgi:1,4-alpha-glucan branching enzyme
MNTNEPLGLIKTDPWLEPYAHLLMNRMGHYWHVKSQIDLHGGLLGPISEGHTYFGFNRGERDGQAGVWYREWAPGAKSLRLIGDFNGWNRETEPMERDEYGVWSLFLPDNVYGDRLVHESLVKVHVVTDHDALDRIPAYARRVVQHPVTHDFTAQFWMPPTVFEFMHDAPVIEKEGLRIYEAHVGMATEEAKVGSFEEFIDDIIPRVKSLGYNAIQLMAIQEHPYYGSFGYHVSSLFAVSSRFGTPEELKLLIDTAHENGIVVLLDIVHSHAVKNVLEGLNHFDGTDHQYFHAGARGLHSAWDSLLYDYSKYEVQRFLLSNVRFWLDEFKFDGFRFDGVTSMLYYHHGLGHDFTSYDDYFGGSVDWDAVVYLQLANELTHTIKPNAITIGEDVSGMPGVAAPVADGGVGFDYRLAMGVPDYWIKTLKEKSDDEWSLQDVYTTLMNRRHSEKHVGYAESHDQALVGDKTMAFRLMDADMYWHMGKRTENIVIDRGVALHKMVRLITFSLAGEAYLNFMGNEFGHPEWVDFPREGNGFSYHFARRQWSLSTNRALKYEGLQAFDADMNDLDHRFHVLTDGLIEQLAIHEDTRQLVYRRGALVFAFNFHPTASYADLRIPVPDREAYTVVLNSDDPKYCGHARSRNGIVYPIQTVPMYGRDQSIQLYLPSRSVQVLAPARLLL